MNKRMRAWYAVPLLTLVALTPDPTTQGVASVKSKPQDKSQAKRVALQKQSAPQRKIKIRRWVKAGIPNPLDPDAKQQWVLVEEWANGRITLRAPQARPQARLSRSPRAKPKVPPDWKPFWFNGRHYYHVPL